MQRGGGKEHIQSHKYNNYARTPYSSARYDQVTSRSERTTGLAAASHGSWQGLYVQVPAGVMRLTTVNDKTEQHS